MKSPFQSVAGIIAPGTWLLLATIGCGDPTLVQPGDIRTYVAPSSPEPVVKTPGQPAATGTLGLTYDVPDGWTDRGASGMRLATLVIESGGGPHEVTVIPAAGTLEANVSRWLGQLDPAATPEELLERTAATLDASEKLPVGDVESTLVSLMENDAGDADDVILGAMIPLGGSSSLFVKFKGPALVARQEREAFARFVSSIRWK